MIKRDAALAARIIRISNSVVYGGGGGVRIGAIEEAVNRVGFSEVYRLVGLVTSDRLAERPLIFYGVEAEPLREHMLFNRPRLRGARRAMRPRLPQRLYRRIDAHDRHASCSTAWRSA